MATNRQEIDDLTFEIDRCKHLLNRAIELLTAVSYGTKDTKVLAINEEIRSFLGTVILASTIIYNAARCKKCGDVIESKSVHDFVQCKCGAIAVDGGHDYLRRVGNPEDFIDMSVMDK